MKIIENNWVESPSWKIVCPQCNSVLEYNREDVISQESRFFYLQYIKCPCCHKSVEV